MIKCLLVVGLVVATVAAEEQSQISSTVDAVLRIRELSGNETNDITKLKVPDRSYQDSYIPTLGVRNRVYTTVIEHWKEFFVHGLKRSLRRWSF